MPIRGLRSRLRAFALAAALLGSTQVAFAQAVSPIDYGADSLADVRLGVAIAALGELTDTPDLLARPSSQQFADDTFARIAIVVPDPKLREKAAARRDALRVTSAPFDRDAASAALVGLTQDVIAAAGGERDPLLAFGIVAEQTDFNARVLRDDRSDAAYRAAIGRNAAADGFVSGLKDLRSQLTGTAREHWDEEATAAEAIVAAVLGSDFAQPFPRSSGVWLVLLRTRTTDAGARRHALHYYLDIVRYDGTHQTIGAYPDGGFAFDRDTDRLTCAIDREAPAPSERAIPVPPGLGSTSAQLAATLVASCVPARTKGLRYRVADADDDRFIADLLFRSGVNVGPVLREAARKS